MNEIKGGDPSLALEDKITEELLRRLPEFATELIEDRPENSNFKENPDDPAEHDAVWHQFGVITHTRKFVEFFDSEAKKDFDKWGVSEKVDSALSQIVDGKSKEQLLRISMALHDLGKFARGFKDKDGKLGPDYGGHEAKSENIIKENADLRNTLKESGLTNAQIDYIARCAGLHYELGKTRSAAKSTELGYTIAFANSPECHAACMEVAEQFPEFQTEIGVLFLCDSLAKTDIRIDAESDQDIEAQSDLIDQQIADRQLNPKLVGAAKQRPINIAIARKYLEII